MNKTEVNAKLQYVFEGLPLSRVQKEMLGDVDASDETTFRRWVATMIGNGLPIDWYEIC